MSENEIAYYVCSILSFVPAIVFHEVMHGYAAYRLGDPTAKRAGRLSLNPLKHIDPFGTVLMPLLLMVMNMPVFGYAKPVPYNPSYFKDLYYFVTMFLPMFSLINLYLMFFNLLPIPPLDGSSIFAFFLPVKYLPKYYQVQRYAFPIFMVVAILLPYVLHVNPFGIYLDATAGNLFDLLYSLAR